MVTRVAGALLAVDLAAASADLAAGLGALGALALGGQLAAFSIAILGIVTVPPYQALTESRITRVPPFGPGTAPLTSRRLRSVSTRTTLRFWIVTRSTP